MSLRKSVVSGSTWAIVGFGCSQLLRIGGNIAVAAILYQKAFALMAIVNAIIMGLAMFSDLGLAPSVVQHRRGDDRAFLNTAWTLQVLRGIALTTVACALAWPTAAFYATNDPTAWELRWLLPLVALGTFVSGFFSSNLMTAARHIKLGRVTIIELVSQVLAVGAMIACALLTKSVYALAIGSLVGALLQCVLSHFAFRGPLNKFHWDKDAVQEIVRFGKWIFVSTVIAFFATQLDKLVFARLFPLDAFGVYSIAAGLAAVASTLMSRLQSMIAFPLFSRMLDHQNDLAPIFKRFKSPILIAGGYIVALCIAGAQTFVDFAYDSRYSTAGTYIPILACGAWFAILEANYGAAFLATGHSYWVAIVNGTKIVAFCLLVAPGAHLGGLTGAVIAVAMSDAVRAAVAVHYARRMNLNDQRSELLFTIYTAIVGFGVMYVSHAWAPLTRLHPFVLLVIEFVLVTIAFAPPLVITARSTFNRSTTASDATTLSPNELGNAQTALRELN